MAQVIERVGQEVDALLHAIDTAERDNTAYSAELSHASGKLQDNKLGKADAKKLIDRIISATKTIQLRSQSMEEQLHNSSQEICELRERLELVRRENLTDELTGVHNRKAFDTALEQRVLEAQSSGQRLCLMICDSILSRRSTTVGAPDRRPSAPPRRQLRLSENVKGRNTAARYGG